MIVLGIDPGLDGALAVLEGDVPGVWDTPTLTVVGKGTKREYNLARMAELVKRFWNLQIHTENHVAHAFIENVHAMPGQGVRSMFSMGYGVGAWHGLLAAYGIKYTLVTPQRWKKALMDGMGKEKAASVVVAQRLWPGVSFVTQRGRSLDGRADALLIAEYGRRTLGR